VFFVTLKSSILTKKKALAMTEVVARWHKKTIGCPASISTIEQWFEGDRYETLAICRTLRDRVRVI